MATYTVILDYRGGTYISQVLAHDARSALLAWAKQIEPGEIQHLGPKRRAKLINDLDRYYPDLYDPTPISGVVNVWCAGCPVPGGLVNIVKTDLQQ